MKKSLCIVPFYTLSVLLLFFASSCNKGRPANTTQEEVKKELASDTISLDTIVKTASATIDTADYNKRMLALSNHDTSGRWPVKTTYPLPGALLPYNRIVAFYGNLFSKRMGILGELPKKQMLEKLQAEVAKWQAADNSVKVIPALHYIAVTAQGANSVNNKHRLRMPFRQIDTIVNWAKSIDAAVFLDIQVGHSSVKEEVVSLANYFKLPNVHLGIDPEFSMKNGETPGTKIGTFTADDINDAIDFLAKIVRENKLPPKVLVVHRFTQGMVTNYKKIKTIPEVQVVINMDGFGDKILKKSTYLAYIYREPVQFTGFKLFYKNDTKKNSNGLYTPEELLKFTPKPIYIQYQ